MNLAKKNTACSLNALLHKCFPVFIRSNIKYLCHLSINQRKKCKFDLCHLNKFNSLWDKWFIWVSKHQCRFPRCIFVVIYQQHIAIRIYIMIFNLVSGVLSLCNFIIHNINTYKRSHRNSVCVIAILQKKNPDNQKMTLDINLAMPVHNIAFISN